MKLAVDVAKRFRWLAVRLMICPRKCPTPISSIWFEPGASSYLVDAEDVRRPCGRDEPARCSPIAYISVPRNIDPDVVYLTTRTSTILMTFKGHVEKNLNSADRKP